MAIQNVSLSTFDMSSMLYSKYDI